MFWKFVIFIIIIYTASLNSEILASLGKKGHLKKVYPTPALMGIKVQKVEGEARGLPAD
jgi:hypothetical protein